MAYFKTHYYGGIKKYQWTTIPAGAPRRGGPKGRHRPHRSAVGEAPGDPIFYVTDLLRPPGVRIRCKKTLAEGVTGESLHILVGSRPAEGRRGRRPRQAGHPDSS